MKLIQKLVELAKRLLFNTSWSSEKDIDDLKFQFVESEYQYDWNLKKWN